MMRQRRLEIIGERGFQQVHREAGMARDLLPREVAEERLGRPLVRRADADADVRQIVEEEIGPMVGRDLDQQIGPRRLEAAAHLAEGAAEMLAQLFRHGLPVARDERAVAGGEHADEAGHSYLLGCRRAL